MDALGDPVVHAANALLAQIALGYEEGWREIRLTTGYVRGQLVLQSADVQLGNNAAPPPSSLLDSDPAVQAALITGACRRLGEALGVDAPLIECVRGQRADQVRVSYCAPIELAHDDQWLGPHVHDELRSIVAATRARQTALDAAIVGHVKRAWPPEDPHHLILEWPDGKTRRLGGALIGSFDRKLGTWMWAWANPQLAVAAQTPLPSAPGLRLVEVASLPAQEAHVAPFATLAAGRLGGRALYRWANPARPVVSMFAIDE